VFEWLSDNETLAWWMLFFSIIFFILSLVMVPVILVCLPEDYFLLPIRHRKPWPKLHPSLRIPLLLVKNLLGVVFILTGILMLALPGQGILTIIIGLVLIDFPGKYHVERWIIARPSVLRAINWIRAKAGKPALLVPLN
jgi:hypothetical protein